MQAEQYLTHHPSQYNSGTCFGLRNGFSYNQRYAQCRPPTGSHYRGRYTGNPAYPDCQPNREGPSQQTPYASPYLCSDAMPCISPVSDIVENGDRLLYPETVDNVSCQMNYIPGFLNPGFLTNNDQVTPSGLESGNGTDFKDISYQVPFQNSWASLRPKEWNTEQVLEWLYSVFPREFEDVKLNAFSNVTGTELVNMSKFEMIKRFENEAAADKAYDYLQKLHYSQNDYNPTPTMTHNNNVSNPTIWPTHDYAYGLSELETDPIRSYGQNYPQYQSTNFDWCAPRSDPDSDGESGHSSLQNRNCVEDPKAYHKMYDPSNVVGIIKPQKKSPGRPRKEGKSRPKNGQRNHRLWEFILALLKDKDTCPRLVKWEDQEEGVFRFVQSDQVAKMWGERKQNPRMTYEKLSRAMRYYYKSNVLQPVIGRRLVYKFGPCATGWRPSEMNV